MKMQRAKHSTYFVNNYNDNNNMTKEELKINVCRLLSRKDLLDKLIGLNVTAYIKTSLPYKVGDKVSTSRADVCWIVSIKPQRDIRGYTGKIEVRINPAKKDGTRSNR